MKVTRSLEWQISRRPFPATVGGVRSLEITLIVEAGGPIVGDSLGEASRDVREVVELLRRAMREPADGPPRKPAVVRVDDAAIAEAIQNARLDLAVVVSDTPEVDEAFAGMVAFLERRRTEPTYLDEGRTEASVRELFVAAKGLWAAAPWDCLPERDVLRVDIPALGVRGACLAVIGALGESFGLLLFPGVEAFDAFLAAGERAGREPKRGSRDLSTKKLDLGSDFLSLELVSSDEVPAAILRESARHELPVAAPDAYPIAELRRRYGDVSLASEREVQVLTAVAFALAAFVSRHAREMDDPELMASESITTSLGPTVTVTFPYEAHDLFEPPQEPAVRSSKVSRNDPCPCGSGKKYKKCHLDEDARAASQASGAAFRGLPEEYSLLVRDIGRFAERRFPVSWAGDLRKMTPSVGDADLQLAVPWMAFAAHAEGRAIAAWYEDDRGHELSRIERAVLAAESAAWLSVWHVLAVEPGVVTAEDLLTGERRRVRDRSGSRLLAPGEAILARVIDYDGASFFSGAHGRALDVRVAGSVVDQTKRKLRRKGTVTADALRRPELGPFLLRAWIRSAEEALLSRIP